MFRGMDTGYMLQLISQDKTALHMCIDTIFDVLVHQYDRT
jgi:hypothetical protein